MTGSLLVGWVNESDFHIPRVGILTDEELYDAEPDRTDAQAKFIMKLMMNSGYKKVEDIHSDFRLKSNGKISIGMAGRVINMLKNETLETSVKNT